MKTSAYRWTGKTPGTSVRLQVLPSLAHKTKTGPETKYDITSASHGESCFWTRFRAVIPATHTTNLHDGLELDSTRFVLLVPEYEAVSLTVTAAADRQPETTAEVEAAMERGGWWDLHVIADAYNWIPQRRHAGCVGGGLIAHVYNLRSQPR